MVSRTQLSLVVAALLSLREVLGQFVTSSGPTPFDPETFSNLLLGDNDIQISNVQFSGDEGQIGTFTDGDMVTGLSTGIVLTTGSISSITSENTDTATTTSLGGSGDADLDALLSGLFTFDSVSLSFDFVTDAETVSFAYVFASEEYNEFVGSQFNDIFAFFVNGENCAMVPESNDPVSVNSINAGSNSQFFLDNADGSMSFEFDGYTTVLQCIANPIPGATNTLKVVIADVSDEVYDSAVFLLGDSFVTGTKTPTPIPDTPSPTPVVTTSPSPSPVVTASPSPSPSGITRCIEGESGACLKPSGSEGFCSTSVCGPRYIADAAGDLCCEIEDRTVYRSCAGPGLGALVCCESVVVPIVVPSEVTSC
mmetsp:Transcript_2368/g.5444  ORF Transcript_2368/g.5444 Transcript_2368/m.5444 type:complete len:367 (-) Transcript_2368:910-2010(-)